MPRNRGDSLEGRIEKVRRAFYKLLEVSEEAEYRFHGELTFPDAIIVEDYEARKFYEITYIEKEDGEIIFGDPREVDQLYVEKRRAEEHGAELAGPIVFKNAAKRIAYAAVLVPGEPDFDGETVTAAKIEDAAHEWLESYGNVDLMHSLNNCAVPVESYILPMPMTVKLEGVDKILPQGSWILASKTNEDTWGKIESGELTGYSVMGIRRAALKESAKKSTAENTAALKRTLLRDLGPDWVAAFVSVVDHPAVPKAKFFALKNAGPAPGSAGALWARIKQVVAGQGTTTEDPPGASLKEGRRFAKDTKKKLKEAFDALRALLEEAEAEDKDKGKSEGSGETKKSEGGGETDMTKDEIMAAVKEAVAPMIQEAIEPIQTELAALKKGKEEEGATGETGTKGEGEAAESEAIKGLEEKVADLEEELQKSRKGASQALRGQDGEATGEDQAYKGLERDTFGRARKSG